MNTEQNQEMEQNQNPQSQPTGEDNNNNDDIPGFDIKTFLPLALGVILVIILFAKLVLPALDSDVDHGASAILEPTEEYYDYGNLFGE